MSSREQAFKWIDKLLTPAFYGVIKTHLMKRTFKRIALMVTLLGVVALILSLFFIRPLLPSSAYTVTAVLDGHPIKAELFHFPFKSGLYYVYLPEAQPNRYRWFGVAFSRKSVFSSGPYSGWWGIRYMHTDQANGGVNLTNSKIEDHWKVSFPSAGVQFSNASLTVTLTP